MRVCVWCVVSVCVCVCVVYVCVCVVCVCMCECMCGVCVWGGGDRNCVQLTACDVCESECSIA